MNARLQVMLESRQLEALAAPDAEVLGMWAKAVRSFHSSTLAGLDGDASFTLAYQAALQLATALVRAAGYRTRGEAHHHHTFAAVAAGSEWLVIDRPALAASVADPPRNPD
jgi:hypothetical protein